MAEEGRVVARFETSPEEFRRAIIALSQSLYGFTFKFGRLGKMFAVVVLLAASFFGFYAIDQLDKAAAAAGWSRNGFVALLIGGMLIGAWLAVMALGQFQSRRLKSVLAPLPLVGEVLVKDYGDWLGWEMPGQRHCWRYDQFDRVLPFDGGYYLLVGVSGAYVPGRAFADADALQAFDTLLRKKLRPEVVSACFPVGKS